MDKSIPIAELDPNSPIGGILENEIISTDITKSPITYGLLCAIDLLPMDKIQGDVRFIQGDFRTTEVQDKIRLLGKSRGRKQADVVLSDMLQNMSGQHDVDHYRSIELCTAALEFCVESLKPGGSFLCKFLRGSDDQELIVEAKLLFLDVKIVKPKASRLESTEMYLLAEIKDIDTNREISEGLYCDDVSLLNGKYASLAASSGVSSSTSPINEGCRG
eukprot:CAMPEP_0119034104 /NCGR_PEP_ID=MMETSP1177-20130426/1147_1 /TAXON_ID=2985 /ORGANISM="Ochromonas sp, Strain CCMP1899" /LENGTH=217 /DNA_ID=CAMNT_0006991337 /DNA_START=389 /DNA_END=1043 /DNA_ORIENTATION=+